MPKMKTRKSVASRFRVTASGKLKHSHPGKRHLMTHKRAKRKRQLSKPGYIAKGLLSTYKLVMGV